MQYENETLIHEIKGDLSLFLKTQNKRHLLITGRMGIGKTTLINQLCPQGSEGLRTKAQKADGTAPRCITMEDISTGETVVCGLPGQGRMVAVASGFDQVGIPVLTRALASDASVFFMDEIGFLEWPQQAYCQALLTMFDTKTVVAVLKKEVTPLCSLLLARNDVYVLDLDGSF